MNLIRDLGPYPTYAPVEEDWLDQVPTSWSCKRLSQGFDSCLVRNDGLQEQRVLSLSYGRVIIKRDEDLHGLVPESFEGYQLVDPGDIIVRGTDLQNDQRSLRIGQAQDRGIITSAYTRLIPRRNLDPRFAYLLLHGYDLMKVFYGYGSGLRQTLDLDDLRRLPIVLPPVEDQAAIVRFLDHIDSRIQRFIAAKERLIELLEEEKRAIIHRAVTRGLDPHVPMKRSGVDWLGDVPAHWRVTRVKSEFACLNHRRRPLSSTEREHRQGSFPYFGASGVIDHVDDFLFDEPLLLVAEDGANLVLRNLPLAIRADGRYWVNNHAHVLRPLRGDIDYLQAVMEAVDYRPYVSGAAQPKLTKDRLLSIGLAVPAPVEQVVALERLGPELAPQDAVSDRARRHIALLREFRTRLISDVVTGKVDVRETARRLPSDPAIGVPELDEQLEEAVA